MRTDQHRAYPVEDASHVGNVRRAVTSLAGALEFGEEDLGRAALLATEMGTNLVKHTPQGGEILVRPLASWDLVGGEEQDLEASPGRGIELIALDRGAGIDNLGRAQRDGFSTSGSPGTGLGALRRVADAFDIYSRTGQGTAVLCHVGVTRPEPSRTTGERCSVTAGGVMLAKPGEEACGDGWIVLRRGQKAIAAVVDGLGHGPDAEQAALVALEVLRENPCVSPAQIIQGMHGPLRATRGAVAAVAVADGMRSELAYAGVGNISARILAEDTWHGLASRNGTLGARFDPLREFFHPCPSGALLIMHSDGLQPNWDLSDFPGLQARSPALIAAVLCRDFARGTDDVAVVALKRTPA